MGSMQLLPPRSDVCQFCAVDHKPGAAHNKDSLFYQMRFNMVHGRSATWADAVAHCDDWTQRNWEALLNKHDAWNEPSDGDAIAEHDFLEYIDKRCVYLIRSGGTSNWVIAETATAALEALSEFTGLRDVMAFCGNRQPHVDLVRPEELIAMDLDGSMHRRRACQWAGNRQGLSGVIGSTNKELAGQ